MRTGQPQGWRTWARPEGGADVHKRFTTVGSVTQRSPIRIRKPMSKQSGTKISDPAVCTWSQRCGLIWGLTAALLALVARAFPRPLPLRTAAFSQISSLPPQGSSHCASMHPCYSELLFQAQMLRRLTLLLLPHVHMKFERSQSHFRKNRRDADEQGCQRWSQVKELPALCGEEG